MNSRRCRSMGRWVRGRRYRLVGLCGWLPRRVVACHGTAHRNTKERGPIIGIGPGDHSGHRIRLSEGVHQIKPNYSSKLNWRGGSSS